MPTRRHRCSHVVLFCFVLLAYVFTLAPDTAVARSAAQANPIVELTIGTSGNGQPITALKIGSGARKFVLVGDTHGGPEANTFRLASRLAAYFRAHTEDIPSSVRLYIIPTLNPDGLALDTRFNGRGVDLNRNMDTSLDACPENDWNVTVNGAYGIVSDTGGPYPESEPESRVIRDFLFDAAGVIFYHSDGGDVFPAFCEHTPSIALAQRYAEATGYRYDRYWRNYLITGGMHDWAGSLGIAAITPELFNGDDDDFEQNLNGVHAILAQADQLLPLPTDQRENDIVVPALIWRYWKAFGGHARFGSPLAPAAQADGKTQQVFERATFVLDPAQADTPYLVQPAPLGRAAAVGQTFTVTADPTSGRFFPETGFTVREAFLTYWEQSDGALLLGYPISDEFTSRAADGQLRAMQYFERGVVAYHPEDNTVRLEPLGWVELVRDRLATTPATQQIR